MNENVMTAFCTRQAELKCFREANHVAEPDIS